MALFGKADKDLPILTKLYQLEFDQRTGEGDIEPFIESFLVNDVTFPDALEFFPGRPGEEKEKEKELKRLARFISLVQRIMSAVADGLLADPNDWDGINELVTAYIRPSIHYVFDEYENASSVYDGRRRKLWTVSYTSPLKVPDNRNDIPLHELKKSVIPSLLNAVDRDALVRCRECGNVYLSVRKGQIYCSHRCARRNSLKKMRDRDREIVKP